MALPYIILSAKECEESVQLKRVMLNLAGQDKEIICSSVSSIISATECEESIQSRQVTQKLVGQERDAISGPPASNIVTQKQCEESVQSVDPGFPTEPVDQVTILQTVAEHTSTMNEKTEMFVKPLKLLLGRGTKGVTTDKKGYSTIPENIQSGPELGKVNSQIPLGRINGAMTIFQSADRESSVSEIDFDLDQLEDSIKCFDLNNSTNIYLPHSLDFLSNQQNRNASETLGEHDSLNKDVDKRTFVRSLSTDVVKEEKFTDGKIPESESASTVSWLNNEEARTYHPSFQKEIDDSPFLSVNVYSSSISSSSLENWKFNGQGSVVWKNEDFGPDEIFRYVESLNVDESYMKDPHISSSSEADCLNYTAAFSSQCTLSPKDIPFIIDWVEVVGAKQRRGSSMWERMVGVKEHIVYCIKVVSGEKQWETLRRYRDFIDFYRQLKQMFNPQTGVVLPSPAEELGEPNPQFGNISPRIVKARSLQIQKYLQLLIKAGPPLSTASPLFWFLRPQDSAFANTSFDDHIMGKTPSFGNSLDGHLSNADASPGQQGGKIDLNQYKIVKNTKLDLKIHSKNPLKQFLYDQHFSCAGCYKHLDLVQGFAQTITRGKPRFCEYTGQLFCSFCHLNEFAVLPSYVLRHWDFTPRRVSQLAKAYLNSIYDQPLLDIASVNPYLYSRVPILLHVKETRTKLSSVLSCMCRPAHGRIEQAMGSRRYLLENNDLFSLRDLEDLSKGAFSVLPPLLSAVLANLVEHVTKQCSVCQDTGEWCGAGVLCEDSFSLIFPFQEENVSNCNTCNASFHKKCFSQCTSCPVCPKDWTNEQGDKDNQGDTGSYGNKNSSVEKDLTIDDHHEQIA